MIKFVFLIKILLFINKKKFIFYFKIINKINCISNPEIKKLFKKI